MAEKNVTGADPEPQRKTVRTAGLFDLRYVLALLFIIYGVVVAIMGATPSQEELDKAAGWNLNLWSGVIMIIVALLFAGWAKWRPVKVTVEDEGEDEQGADADAGRQD